MTVESRYEIEEVTRYAVLRVSPDGKRVPLGSEYPSYHQAQQCIDDMIQSQQKWAAKLERDSEGARIGRRRGRWTPETIRTRMASDRHWEILPDGGRDGNEHGYYRCVWRELDKDGEPQLQAKMIVVQCHDQRPVQAAQFTLTGTSGSKVHVYEYATPDRLVAALFKRELIEL